MVRDFILPHGLVFYRSVLSNHFSDQKAIGAFLAPLEGQRITARDVGRGPRCMRDKTSEEIAKRLDQFVLGGWLTPKQQTPWNREWTVAGGLVARFRTHIEEYRQYCEQVVQKILSNSEED